MMQTSPTTPEEAEARFSVLFSARDPYAAWHDTPYDPWPAVLGLRRAWWRPVPQTPATIEEWIVLGRLIR